MIELKVYRHKVEKDVYLIRNWNVVGGNPDTDFYKATTDIIEAVRNTNMKQRDKFESWFKEFDGTLYVKYTLRRHMEFDGFEGDLEKEIKLYVRDFEMVILREVNGD